MLSRLCFPIADSIAGLVVGFLRLPPIHLSLLCPACLPYAAAEVNRLISQRLVECTAQMLLMARGGVEEGAPEPPKPWFSGRLLVRAVDKLAEMGGGGAGANKQALLSKVGDIVMVVAKTPGESSLLC